MKKLSTAIALVMIVGVAATAFAADGETLRPRRPGDGAGGGPGIARGGPGIARAKGEVNDAAAERLRQHRLAIIHRLLETEEGKALRAQFEKDLEALRAERQALHEAIRKDIQGGKTPQEAFAAHEAEIKALIKKRLELAITFREKLLALADEKVDVAVGKIYDRLIERILERRGPGGPRRPQAGNEPAAE